MITTAIKFEKLLISYDNAKRYSNIGFYNHFYDNK